MEPTTARSRSSLLAAVLSLLCAGLGHVYVEVERLGITLFLLTLLLAPIPLAASWLPPSNAVLTLIVTSVLALVAIYLFAIIDAWRRARGAADPPRIGGLNRFSVYLLFILVGTTHQALVTWMTRSVAFETYIVAAASMHPNVLNGDRVLVNRNAFEHRAPRRGEVVAFRGPSDRSKTFLKRLVAFPGEVVEVRSNEVWVDGRKLDVVLIPDEMMGPLRAHVEGDLFEEENAGARYRIQRGPMPSALADHPQTRVPDGECFFLGDNRDRSFDSRGFGSVPIEDFIGPVEYVLLPADGLRRFGMLR